jgi:hypothetical protein
MSQPTQPVSSPLSNDDQSNPLDKLEELIKSTQQSVSTTSRPGSSTPATLPAVAASFPDQQAQSDADDFERINQLKQQQGEKDQVLVARQQEIIRQTVQESPQTQVRQQAKQADSDQSQQAGVADGMQIRQLQHTTIKKEDE